MTLLRFIPASLPPWLKNKKDCNRQFCKTACHFFCPKNISLGQVRIESGILNCKECFALFWSKQNILSWNRKKERMGFSRWHNIRGLHKDRPSKTVWTMGTIFWKTAGRKIQSKSFCPNFGTWWRWFCCARPESLWWWGKRWRQSPSLQL